MLADPDARRVDFHLIVIDDRGNGIYGPAEHGDVYPAASLAAMGRIGGRAVRCLTPEYQVESHPGYEIGATDRHDVLALHERFGVPLPPEYRSG